VILAACGLKREARIATRAGMLAVAGGGDDARLEAELDALAGQAQMILSFGLCGALSPHLGVGDVVLGTELYTYTRHPGLDPGSTALRATPSPVAPWTLKYVQGEGSPEASMAVRGPVFASKTILATAAEKECVFRETGAIAVDMESYIAARVAARHALPFAILRVVSDRSDHALPPAALVGMSRDGGTNLGAVLGSLRQNPGQLPALIRTGLHAERAFSTLSRLASTAPLQV